MTGFEAVADGAIAAETVVGQVFDQVEGLVARVVGAADAVVEGRRRTRGAGARYACLDAGAEEAIGAEQIVEVFVDESVTVVVDAIAGPVTRGTAGLGVVLG